MRNRIVKKEKYNVEISYFERNGDVVLVITKPNDLETSYTFSGLAATRIIDLIKEQSKEES